MQEKFSQNPDAYFFFQENAFEITTGKNAFFFFFWGGRIFKQLNNYEH